MDKTTAKFIYSVAQRARGEKVFAKLAQLNKNQWLSRSQIERQQRNRLEEILHYCAENIPFYRERLKEAKEFEKIPLLSSEEVRENLDSMISKQYSKNKLLKYHSSGSTGEPLTLYFTSEAMGYFHAAQYRGFSWYRLEPVDKCVKLWGVPLETEGRMKEGLKDFVMNRVRISAFDMSGESMEEYFRKCLQFKPAFLYGYASALAKFAMFVQENNLDGRRLGLRAVVSTSEVLYEHQREIIEIAFGCKVANEYGAAEVGIIAFECPEGSMHITAENVYLELLNNGVFAKEGEPGEVVVTGLRNYAMPLIRYKLGDVASYSGETCPCGRGLPVLKSIQGRDNDMVVSPNGKVIHSEVFAYINRDLIKQGFLIREFKIVQKAKDELKVLVLKDTKENALLALQEQIHRHIGKGMQINIEYVDDVPREKSGKVRYFTSELWKK